MDARHTGAGPIRILFLAAFLAGLWLASGLRPAPSAAADESYRNSLGMDFRLIPAGTFVMGSPQTEPDRKADESPHPVTLSKPFYLQVTEVTLGQWRAVMGRAFFFRRKGDPDSPVTRVSWHDAVDFVSELNRMRLGTYRLPSEAEWEYACRAGSRTAFSWGDGAECSRAMFDNNTLRSGKCAGYAKERDLPVHSPAPVKSFAPNAWGLYDMHGNVWEWCQDWYGEYPASQALDPAGPPSGNEKVRRGGSWFGESPLGRSANRNYGHPASRYQTTGFRLVLVKLPTLVEIEDREQDGP